MKCCLCKDLVEGKYSIYGHKKTGENIYQCKRCYRYYQKAPINSFYVANGDTRKDNI